MVWIFYYDLSNLENNIAEMVPKFLNVYHVCLKRFLGIPFFRCDCLFYEVTSDFSSCTNPQPRVIGSLAIHFHVEVDVVLIEFHYKVSPIGIFKLWILRIFFSRVDTKQGMK